MGEPEGLTPSDPRGTPLFRPHKPNERKEDLGRESRTSQRMTRAVEENPALSLVITIVVSVVAMAAKDTIRQNATVPSASSVQIEAVLTKVETLASKMDEVKGDLRSLKDSNLGERVHIIENFVVEQRTLNQENGREIAERRRGWEEWRKQMDAAVLELRKGK